MAQYLQASDAIAGTAADMYITTSDNKRYHCIHFIDFTASYKPTISTLPRLGTPTKGHRASGGEGTFKGSAYFVSPIGAKMMDEYNKTGVMPYFTIQVTVEDKASRSGRQTVILNNCLFDELPIITFNADSDDYLSVDVSGTFDDFEVPESFSFLPGILETH